MAWLGIWGICRWFIRIAKRTYWQRTLFLRRRLAMFTFDRPCHRHGLGSRVGRRATPLCGGRSHTTTEKEGPHPTPSHLATIRCSSSRDKTEQTAPRRVGSSARLKMRAWPQPDPNTFWEEGAWGETKLTLTHSKSGCTAREKAMF